MDRDQFQRVSHGELYTNCSGAKTVSIAYSCPTYNGLVILLNDMDRTRTEDRAVFVLCDCGAVHELN